MPDQSPELIAIQYHITMHTDEWWEAKRRLRRAVPHINDRIRILAEAAHTLKMVEPE